jgi:hypothetical protein
MSFLESLPLIGDMFKGIKDIASEAIEDKDKANELISKLDELKNVIDKEVYLAELGTATIPWADALHKLGRQILNFLQIAAVVVLMLCGQTITPEVALALTGSNVAYQLIKGKGK